MSQQPERDEDSFDLDATEQELLDEFGLLVAAEYYYVTSSTPMKPAGADAVPVPGDALAEKKIGEALDKRLSDALQKQKDLLKD